MPKLLTFLSCERVIVDRQTDQISLISLLTAVNVPLPPDGSDIPEKTFAPFPWAALTIWQREPTDKAQYEQMVFLLGPDGQTLISVGQPVGFKLEAAQNRVINVFTTFPVWKSGACILRLQFRKTTDHDWRTAAEFPIEVQHGKT